jgi:hypothetical protein
MQPHATVVCVHALCMQALPHTRPMPTLPRTRHLQPCRLRACPMPTLPHACTNTSHAGVALQGTICHSWGVPMFSRHAAATLRTLDVSWCSGLDSIAALSDCAQLRCLRMRGCIGVADLSPLGACSQLEELWMAGNAHVTSLEPLMACPRLRKLDLSDCNPVLDGQVEDLQRACLLLAHPSSVVLDGLVHELQPTPPGGQAFAARALRSRAFVDVQQRTAIAAAGAIPPLVQLLLGSAPRQGGVHATAASALTILARNHVPNQAAITAAGAIPLLVQLLGQHSSPITVQAAANTLAELALSHAQQAADAITPLVQLLEKQSSAPGIKVAAARALRYLADDHTQKEAAVAAGAILPLVQMLFQVGSADVQTAGANALAVLALGHAQNKAAITAAGAIPALVHLTGQPPSLAEVQSAMMCPPRAAAYTLNILGFYTQR